MADCENREGPHPLSLARPGNRRNPGRRSACRSTGRLRPRRQAAVQGPLLGLPRCLEARGRAPPRHGRACPQGGRRRPRARSGQTPAAANWSAASKPNRTTAACPPKGSPSPATRLPCFPAGLPPAQPGRPMKNRPKIRAATGRSKSPQVDPCRDVAAALVEPDRRLSRRPPTASRPHAAGRGGQADPAPATLLGSDRPAADGRRSCATFSDDPRPDAWERVVDRLLANPHYGERWGRHWMDIWRYSDWYGLGEQVRNAQKHMWHWRDWIVESLNEAKGYDRMLEEMLAADEIAPLDANARRATGFLVRNYYLFNRTTWLDATVEHTSKAFLGVTLNCAKCHDHKFDPFSQVDYYRFRAIFEPYQVRMEMLPGETDLERDGLPTRVRRPPRRADLPLAAGRREAARSIAIAGRRRAGRARVAGVRGDTRQPPGRSVVAVAATVCPRHVFRRGRPAGRAGRPRLGECPQPPQGDRRPPRQRRRPWSDAKGSLRAGSHPRELCGKVAASGRGASLDGAGLVRSRPRAAEGNFRDGTPSGSPQPPPNWRGPNRFRRPTPTRPRSNWQPRRGRPHSSPDKGRAAAGALARKRAIEHSKGPLDVAALAAIRGAEGPAETEAARRTPFPRTSTGRRTALARWLVDRKNPLTARVAVNHVWMRHMNRPLVESVADFGLRSPSPPEKELLDWLANDFMDHGWNLKRLDRLIVTSHAYRRSSDGNQADAATRQADPENVYFWKYPSVTARGGGDSRRHFLPRRRPRRAARRADDQSETRNDAPPEPVFQPIDGRCTSDSCRPSTRPTCCNATAAT